MDRRAGILYLSLIANLIFAFIIYFTLFQSATRQLFLHQTYFNGLQKANSDTGLIANNVNTTNVKLQYLTNRPCAKPCQGNEFMLLMINSAPGNDRRRSAIRQTWGKADMIRSAFGNHIWRTIFIIGNTFDKALNSDVHKESLKFGDMVLADFQDDFRNLTYKTVLAMEWANSYCSSVKYYYKGDDDVLLNPLILFRKLISMNAQNIFMGHVMSACKVNRQPYNRYYVSQKDFSPAVYPDYCSGFAYVLSMDVVQSMVAVAPKIPKIPIDDAYVGILAKEIKISARSDHRFKPFGPSPRQLCQYNDFIAVHGVLPTYQKPMMIKARKAFLVCV